MTEHVPREIGLELRMRRESVRISSQHRQLDEHWARVREALERGETGRARRTFAHYADALEAHLSLEDDFYYPALHGLSPALGGELAALAREHTSLRSSLASVREELARSGAATSSSTLTGFFAALADHERREEALLARALPRVTQG